MLFFDKQVVDVFLAGSGVRPVLEWYFDTIRRWRGCLIHGAGRSLTVDREGFQGWLIPELLDTRAHTLAEAGTLGMTEGRQAVLCVFRSIHAWLVEWGSAPQR